MDYLQAFAISAAGMTAERTRIDVAALNLANANTMQGPDGVRFQPLRVVSTSAAPALSGSDADGDFAARVDAGLAQEASPDLASFGVPQVSIVPSAAAPKQVYEPDNPFASAKGFVTYPGVNTATEMVGMMGAMRAYEANVAVMNMEKTLVLRTLDIGGAQS